MAPAQEGFRQSNTGAVLRGANGSGHNSPRPPNGLLRREPSASELSETSARPNARSPRPPSPRDSMLSQTASGYTAPPPIPTFDGPSPFQSVVEDLRSRIIDWKGHPLTGPNGLGPLLMFDLLKLRRDMQERDFSVYLFREAIICVTEEKRRLRNLLSGSAGNTFGESASSTSSGRYPLRLKGRIYIRHIRRVQDTSTQNDLSLTIDMEDERIDSFVLLFKDHSSLQTWRQTIAALIAQFQTQPQRNVNMSRGMADMEEFGSPEPAYSDSGSARYVPSQPFPYPANSKAARMLSGSTGTSSLSQSDSLLNGSRASSSTSNGLHTHGHSGSGSYGNRFGTKSPPLYGSIPEEEPMMDMPPEPSTPTPHIAAAPPSNALPPLQHAPLDLILVLALPPAALRVHPATRATAELKLRVVRGSLDFVIASLGRRDRLSVVTFEAGAGGAGRVRKTPFLGVGRAQSRMRLTNFADAMGKTFAADRDPNTPVEEGQELMAGSDEFLVRGSKDEKTDVVTAVNHALDVVLQRKARNPISGMILVSDAADSTRRAQMDLVLARAEAANLPIHSFGYGRAHDPASLWLMSNHTNGTYTFVRDWYDLRDCMAGCIGGMMSIGLTAMKLHMKVVDGHRFRIRKVSGAPTAILSSDGRDVDVEMGELRYGERKEMLVELELDNRDRDRDMLPSGMAGLAMNGSGVGGGRSATDEFNARMGFDSLSMGDSNLVDGVMERMIDEVPVFEVDGAFYDPASQKQVSRLAHPVLLTVTLLPHGSGAKPPQGPNDPMIVRRRMELLTSDMITRALVLVSRKNYAQAQRTMAETKRILLTVLQSVASSLPPPGQNSGARNRREALALASVRTLQSIMQDIQVLAEGLEENTELFAHDQRNFGAQQAMILRDQKAWTGRTATEKLFWTTDNSIELVSRSTDWLARD